MHYSDIIAKLLEMFPGYQDKIYQWSPFGRSGIKVKLRDGQTIEFIYFNAKHWSLATANQKK